MCFGNFGYISDVSLDHETYLCCKGYATNSINEWECEGLRPEQRQCRGTEAGAVAILMDVSARGIGVVIASLL